jgi:hypothetical protein
MKDVDGDLIGFELLHYRTAERSTGLAVETVISTTE